MLIIFDKIQTVHNLWTVSKQSFTTHSLRSTIQNNIIWFLENPEVWARLSSVSSTPQHPPNTKCLYFLLPFLFLLPLSFSSSWNLGYFHDRGEKIIWLFPRPLTAIQLHFWKQTKAVAGDQNTVILLRWCQLHCFIQACLGKLSRSKDLTP